MSNHKKISNKIEELTIDNPDTPFKLSWVNITGADQKEIDYLKKRFNFSTQHLNASVATVFSQRPMIFDEDGYIFMILHFPIFENNKIIPAEIEFFIGHGFLITAHNNNIPALGKFFEYCKDNQDSLLSYANESSVMLLYEILDRLIKDCYPLIDKNSIKVDEVEEQIFSQTQKQTAGEILSVKRNIINLRKILQNHKNILKHLTEMRSSIVERDLIKKHYDGLVEHSKRIWEMLDIQKDIIDALHDTNESISNAKMTSVMKTLTMFSVIVFPLTLFAALFAMRTAYMPLETHPYGFWLIIGIMAVITAIMLTVFKKKHWM
ncbi:MAG: magnesium transporter CorA family protein [Patescibacteria group bacterium]